MMTVATWSKGIVVLGVTAAIAGAAWIALGVKPGSVTTVDAQPVYEYEASLNQLAAQPQRDGVDINTACTPRLFSHGRKVERVAVLLHGFTSCPRQFELLGQTLFEQGWNVLIPRFPRHGLASPMTEALAHLTAEELVRAASHHVDLAHGLGDTVTVVGLSQGGVIAAYLAQHRGDIGRVVTISPSLAPHGVSQHLSRRLTNVLLIAPNVFRWWDPDLKQEVGGPKATYPRYSTRALCEIYQLGHLVWDEASHESPSAASIVVVTNANDTDVNNEAVRALEVQWRRHGGHVRAFEFMKTQDRGHDLNDPEQPYESVAEVYPVLLRLISGYELPPKDRSITSLIHSDASHGHTFV